VTARAPRDEAATPPADDAKGAAPSAASEASETPDPRARWRAWGLTAALVLGTLLGRAIVEGSICVRRSDDALARGEVDAAVAYAMRATKWYVPFAPHVEAGYERLRTIARRAEAAGDADGALIAWQAIRAGARGTRSLWTPFADRLAEADEHIATLLGSKPPPGVDRDKPREQRVREHLELLATAAAPAPLAVVALYLGLAAWLYGAHRALSAFSARARAARLVWTGALVAAAGLAVFLFALARA
jgi:hypothetical protein